MNEKELKKLLRDYLNGTISPEDERRLEALEAGLISKNRGGLINAELSKQAVSQKLNRSIRLGKSRQLLSHSLRVAAGLAILFVLGRLVLQQDQETKPEQQEVVWVEKATPWGEKLSVSLPDGTRVKLNSGSSIKFPMAFTGDKRRVELQGEAFFDVAENKEQPFIIRSGDVETKVLGTSFNVDAFEERDEVAVSVLTGKVMVSTANSQVFLTPGEQGIYNRQQGKFTRDKVDIERVLLWKDGIIHFKDAPFQEVAKVLERWYGVNITFENEQLKQCHLTATYKNESLATVLGSIAYAKKGVQYNVQEKENILLSGRCSE